MASDASVDLGGRPTKLTDERFKDIVDLVKGGAFDWVAAEAAGVHRTTFRRWMSRGEIAWQLQEAGKAVPEDEALYLDFYLKVQGAAAFARVVAEMQVRSEDPKWWLTKGPGKTRPGRPGWTDTVIVETVDDRTQGGAGEVDEGELAARVLDIVERARRRKAEATAAAPPPPAVKAESAPTPSPRKRAARKAAKP